MPAAAAAAASAGDADTNIVRRAAYIFSPSEDEDHDVVKASTTSHRSGRKQRRRDGEDGSSRSGKKRRTVGDGGEHDDGIATDNALEAFPTLLQGRETSEAVALRRHLFESTWADLDGRIQTVLQRSNQATLDAVTDFIEQPTSTKLPAAFIILGPASTTDMLLFRQLEALSRAASSGDDGRVRRMVRLRAAEAPNLRTTLKAIVQEVTATTAADYDEVMHDGKFLAYDLEAVYAVVRGRDARIIITFEDSEAFDSGVLADLLAYLHSWLDRIPFVLLFGVATSVDLFQARLPKTAAQRLMAAQFDVAPSSSVLDQLVRRAVAAADVPLRIGPHLLRSLAERQDEQVVSVSVFVNSLKYAYMCYFYANPLSVLLNPEASSPFLEQKDYVDALRHLPSFRRHVERSMHTLPSADIIALLDDDTAFCASVTHQFSVFRRWMTRLLRAVHLASVSGAFADWSFTELYAAALEGGGGGGGGVDDDDDGKDSFVAGSLADTLANAIRRMSATDLITLAKRLAEAVHQGDAELALDSVSKNDADKESESWQTLGPALTTIADEVEVLRRKVETGNQSRSRGGGVVQLRSKYTAQSKVLRTTVVAQKVQLSRDSAALTAEDQAFTELVDRVVALVVAEMDAEPAEPLETDEKDDVSSLLPALWLQEVWLYDARTPYREVFIPRPVLALERALLRPHDYLACKCCGIRGGNMLPTLPPTAILYQLYREAGTLINVADLWAAFQAAVRGQDEEEEDDDDSEVQRRRLVQFYHGLAELKVLGFVKATRKKADHVAKVNWL